MPPDIRGYLDRVLRTVAHEATLRDVQVDVTPSPERGYTRGTAHFSDGSRLRFTVVVQATSDDLATLKYAFHYLDAELHTVFRYDNTGRHREVDTFPHHKHVGAEETVVPSEPPSMETVLEEIRGYLTG